MRAASSSVRRSPPPEPTRTSWLQRRDRTGPLARVREHGHDLVAVAIPRRPEAGFPRRWRTGRGPSCRCRTRAGPPSGRTRARPSCGCGAVTRSSQSRMYSPSAASHLAARGCQRGGCKSLRRRKRVGEESGFRVARVAGPPADLDLLGVPGVAGDEVGCRRLDRLAGEEAHGEVERAPPRVDRGGAAAIGRAERREHERRLRRCREVRRDLAGSYVACSSSSSSGVVQVVSCGVRLISTGPPSRRTAARTPTVTCATDRFGASGTRSTRPSECSTVASWDRRSRATTIAPDPSGAGSGSVSQPRAVRRSAACCSWGSGGARAAASLPRTWVCA